MAYTSLLMTKREKGKLIFTMLSDKGDERLVWDSADPKQITEAMENFCALLKQGFSAFVVDAAGKLGRALKPDDLSLEEVRQAEEITFIRPIAGG